MSQERISKVSLEDIINRDIIFSDYPDFSEITDNVRTENASRVFTGGVRINMGMYRTKEETDEYIRTSLSKKLP